MGRKAGCRFQISIINEGTNNTFVLLTVNLPECYHCQQGKNPAKHFNFISHISYCAFPSIYLASANFIMWQPKITQGKDIPKLNSKTLQDVF